MYNVRDSPLHKVNLLFKQQKEQREKLRDSLKQEQHDAIKGVEQFFEKSDKTDADELEKEIHITSINTSYEFALKKLEK